MNDWLHCRSRIPRTDIKGRDKSSGELVILTIKEGSQLG